MSKPAVQDTLFRDETIVIPEGEVGYWLLLNDEEAELLAHGVCPDRVKERAWEMTGWKRPAAEDPFFNRLAKRPA